MGISFVINGLMIELLDEKTNNSICENKGTDQLLSNQEADQRLCFCYRDCTIPLLSKFKICSLQSSVAVQPGLCQTWPRGYKAFFKLSSAEHEISTAHKC